MIKILEVTSVSKDSRIECRVTSIFGDTPSAVKLHLEHGLLCTFDTSSNHEEISENELIELYENLCKENLKLLKNNG